MNLDVLKSLDQTLGKRVDTGAIARRPGGGQDYFCIYMAISMYHIFFLALWVFLYFDLKESNILDDQFPVFSRADNPTYVAKDRPRLEPLGSG